MMNARFFQDPRRALLNLAVSALLLPLTAPSALAERRTISFDSLPVGTIVTNQFSGVDISLLGASPIAGPRTYALKDLSGNPLNIFGASGNAITPGNNVGGINPPFFDIQFKFSHDITFFAIQSIDAEEKYGLLIYKGDQLVQIVNGPGVLRGIYNGSVFSGPSYLISFGDVNGPAFFDRVVVSINGFSGPELFDNVDFNSPVPEIDTSLMLAVGIVGLALYRRSSRARVSDDERKDNSG